MAFWQIGWCTPKRFFFLISRACTISLGIFSRSSSASSNWLVCSASCTRRTVMNWLVVLYTPGCCTLWPAMGQRRFGNLLWHFLNPKQHVTNLRLPRLSSRSQPIALIPWSSCSGSVPVPSSKSGTFLSLSILASRSLLRTTFRYRQPRIAQQLRAAG